MYEELKQYTKRNNVSLVAVSKTKPLDKIREVYDKGQRIFGENRVQELVEKHAALPDDIQWHMIGHLQTKKLKLIAPFIHTIHSVDRLSLLEKINEKAKENDRKINVLLQLKIATETSKFGFDKATLLDLFESGNHKILGNLNIIGLMGMASFTNDEVQLVNEFSKLKNSFDLIKQKYFSADTTFKEISMGMSGDYKIAIAQGSTMVRIGSLIFGSR